MTDGITKAPRTSAESAVEVEVPPELAFAVFTEELDLWWVRGPINFFDASRLAEYRMEPGVGGRVLEVYDDAAGDVLEIGRITMWDPGVRLVFRSTLQDTETDVTFAPTAAGTQVTVRQYLVAGGDPAKAGFGWPAMLRTFRAWCRRRAGAPRAPREIGRLGVTIFYADPPAAARWLKRVFQLGDWDVDEAPAEGASPGWVDFHVGDCVVALLPATAPRTSQSGLTHEMWVYVDDLDAHLDHAVAEGATIVEPITTYGSRSYLADDIEGHRWRFTQARPTM
jgi:uncharacterized glyoxalase superfamily protein PhnB